MNQNLKDLEQFMRRTPVTLIAGTKNIRDTRLDGQQTQLKQNLTDIRTEVGFSFDRQNEP